MPGRLSLRGGSSGVTSILLSLAFTNSRVSTLPIGQLNPVHHRDPGAAAQLQQAADVGGSDQARFALFQGPQLAPFELFASVAGQVDRRFEELSRKGR